MEERGQKKAKFHHHIPFLRGETQLWKMGVNTACTLYSLHHTTYSGKQPQEAYLLLMQLRVNPLLLMLLIFTLPTYYVIHLINYNIRSLRA